MNSRAILFTAILALALSAPALAAEQAPQKVIDLAHDSLVKLGLDAAVVSAVKQENAKGKTLEAIKTRDAEWKKTAGIDAGMKALMESACGQRLREIESSQPYYAEIFVMDNLGANTCMSFKTSDYWQGDEAKFTESYKDGAGAVHIGSVKFDDSSQAYLVQVSIPVLDGDKVVGAMTIGIDMDKVN